MVVNREVRADDDDNLCSHSRTLDSEAAGPAPAPDLEHVRRVFNLLDVRLYLCGQPRCFVRPASLRGKTRAKRCTDITRGLQVWPHRGA